MNIPTARREEELFKRVSQIIESAQRLTSRSVNIATVHAYWKVGQEIVEIEQEGSDRADYGEQLMEKLSERLRKRFGRGFSVPTLRRIRQFYLTYPRGSAIPREMSQFWNR